MAPSAHPGHPALNLVHGLFHSEDEAVAATKAAAPAPPPTAAAQVTSAATTTAPTPAPPRAVFILFEGTGNDFDNESYTNVVRMLRLLRKDDEERQIVYYGEGIGEHNFSSHTLSAGTKTTYTGHALSVGLAASFPEHVLDAYRWLMNVHRASDEIYIMGFSRGAYAAGCLCGLIEQLGLLPRENTQMIATAWEFYEKLSSTSKLPLGNEHNEKQKKQARKLCRSFRTSFSKLVRIQFLGLWDTVASLGATAQAPYLFPQHRGTVRDVYHAMALDEVRNRFTVQRFSSLYADLPPLYRALSMSGPNFKKEIAEAKALTTNVHEVWFAGNHSDVGGGGHNDGLLGEKMTYSKGLYRKEDLTVDVERRFDHPSLSFLPLRWMLRSLFSLRKKEGGPKADILIDPLTAARYGLELSYGLSSDPTHGDPDLWPSEHLIHLINTTGTDDRQRALTDARQRGNNVLGAPLPEIEMASLRSYTAFQHEPDSKGLMSTIMPYYWSFREVMDYSTKGETREVHEDDSLHISVRTRWLASRLPASELERILGRGQHATYEAPSAPVTLFERARGEIKWDEATQAQHLLDDAYTPLAHQAHTLPAKRHPSASQADKDRIAFWEKMFAKREEAKTEEEGGWVV